MTTRRHVRPIAPMSETHPATIEDYIRAAPPEGHAHLRRLYELLREVAPDADSVMKWNQPFFVEPRFLYGFGAHKRHLGFAPSEGTLDAFRDDLEGYEATKNTLKVPYDGPFPEGLIRRMAEHQLRTVSQRETDSFW